MTSTFIAAKDPPTRYAPESRLFSCELPAGWRAFEEEDALGPVARLLGPDDPSGVYRAGIDVRFFEKGSPGWAPYKQAIDSVRRGDKETDRSSGGVTPMRISGQISRIFEVAETRRLPLGLLPSKERELHRYVAFVPSGESYYEISLSSTRETYLDYRDLFVDFLRSFKTLGAR